MGLAVLSLRRAWGVVEAEEEEGVLAAVVEGGEGKWVIRQSGRHVFCSCWGGVMMIIMPLLLMVVAVAVVVVWEVVVGAQQLPLEEAT